MSKTHWGEIPEPPKDELFTPDVSADIEKSMDEHCLDEYQNGDEYLHIEDIKLSPMDPHMTYAISLHKYMNDMTELIQVAELAVEKKLIPSKDAKPMLPEPLEIDSKHKPNNLNFLLPYKENTEDRETEIPDVSEAIVKPLLVKSVATMFAHIGFETTFQSVLDTMTEVLEDFLVKICRKFVEASDEEQCLNTGGFPNPLERILFELGLGGIKGLNDYYQKRVIKYISVLQKRCKELDEYYLELLKPQPELPEGEFGKLFKVEVKEEEDNMDSDNPELHVTTLDSNVFTTGYQLLDSLEAADANLQGLANDANDGF